jgi:hypothetical protein
MTHNTDTDTDICMFTRAYANMRVVCVCVCVCVCVFACVRACLPVKRSATTARICILVYIIHYSSYNCNSTEQYVHTHTHTHTHTRHNICLSSAAPPLRASSCSNCNSTERCASASLTMLSITAISCRRRIRSL